MKKLIMLSVVGVFTLSSFGLKEKDNKTVKLSYWRVACGGVPSGQGFWCEGCTQEEANNIANLSGICK